MADLCPVSMVIQFSPLRSLKTPPPLGEPAGPLLLTFLPIASLTTPDFSLFFNRCDSPRRERSEQREGESLGTPSRSSRMETTESKITSQGQVSIPARIRRKLGLTRGSKVEWCERGEEVFVRRASKYSSLDIHKAVFGTPPARRSIEGRVEGRRVTGRVRWLIRRFRAGPQSESRRHVSSPRSPNPAGRFPAPGSPVESCDSHTGFPVAASGRVSRAVAPSSHPCAGRPVRRQAC